MSTIRATCPACNKAFDVPAKKAREKVECPECFEVFTAEKPGGPKIKVVLTYEPPAGKGRGKAKPAGRRRDEDDDDEYDHDHRDDEDYGRPPSTRGLRSASN